MAERKKETKHITHKGEKIKVERYEGDTGWTKVEKKNG